ncbi:MAG: hypothetical protein ACREBX_19560 [Sphingopyxis sp.]
MDNGEVPTDAEIEALATDGTLLLTAGDNRLNKIKSVYLDYIKLLPLFDRQAAHINH